MKTRSVTLLVIAHAASDINQGAIPALLPFLIAEHRITYAAAAAMVFAVNLVSTVFQPVFGHMADRRSRPWTIPVAMFAIGCGVAFSGIAPSYLISFAGLVVCGLGIALFHPEGAKLMNHLAGDRKATAMSLFAVGGQLGFAIGPIMATAILLSQGLKGTIYFVIPTAVMAAYMVYALPGLSAGYMGRANTKDTEPRTAGRDAWPAFICLSSALLLRSVVFYGLNTFLPLYWINVLHQSKGAGGTALGILLCSAMIGNFLGGRSADRFGYRLVSITGFVLLSALLPFLAFAEKAVSAMALLIPIGFLLAAPFGPMVVLGQSYLPNRVGLASGITLGLAFSFGGLTVPILGWIADHHGLRTSISIVAFLPLVCTALLLMLPGAKKAATASGH